MAIPIAKILHYASFAPSVHNTQPWRFVAKYVELSLFSEPTRTLKAGDPTTRELWVSLGICLEAVILASKGLGYTATITFIQTDDPLQEIARLRFEEATEAQPELLELLQNRHSYRDDMKPTTLPPSLIASCRQTIHDLPNTSLVLVETTQTIQQIADITDKGMRLALSSSAFRKELAPLLHYNWSKSKTGLHGYVMGHNWLGSIWQKWSILLGVDGQRQAKADKQRVLQASGLLFITSRGDVPHFWFEVGRAYLRVVLEITREGYAHSTLTAPVEAARFHEDIEKMLHTTDRIQSMIRIGKATHPLKHTSPRLPAEELLT
ncbi:MAG TPA: hypothetical protein VFH06_02500 [Candidatus Saccharimonadales bacterium]|nr:hypothetical protein [Candidatus Saccharimonadales bacterium]